MYTHILLNYLFSISFHLVDLALVGHIALDGASPRVISCTASGVVAAGPNRIEIVRSSFRGIGTDVGIAITGGAGHLIDVLLGKQEERIARLGHDRLPTFGIGQGRARFRVLG